MKSIAILLTREPYGEINAAEAVRHALGAVGEELEVSLLLMGGGALLAAKEQDEAGTEFTNLGEALKDCVDMGITVGVDEGSLGGVKLERAAMVEGVEVMGLAKVAELVRAADQTMIF
jgi:sulfur relay (sulfurtransferase) DsrF/TusC family protein